ncbi:hypothetical protein FHS79_002521 [Polymorphobacter multimanifer]|uniref:Helix-turn-helix domain-containing protein n=1 Tax=Polymorphobacter multimanifer TaxID=1070431 RepID=A0A841L805_9SPHN|nr:hypothetical protein [Polymorphobacter multimanifer]MBB6228336.1 hypothetical protein [Polymorphobacter multimanifer]
MSNRLHNLAKHVTSAGHRRLRPSEKSVLLILADDARDAHGGRSRLTTRQICTISGLSPRAVGLAYATLAQAGLITREATCAGGAFDTLVHPNAAPAEFAGVAKTVVATPSQNTRPLAKSATPLAKIATPLANSATPLIDIRNLPIDHTPKARVCEHCRQALPEDHPGPVPVVPAVVAEPAVQPSAQPHNRAQPDAVAQVFDAWDRMAVVAGLPGPVARDVPREAAIHQALQREPLWRLLQSIRKVGESDWLTKRKNRQQGDFMASFDYVFGVGRWRNYRVLTRLLEGEFNGGSGVPLVAPAAPPVAGGPVAGGPGAGRESRTAARARQELLRMIGERSFQAWFGDARFVEIEDGVTARLPGPFNVDFVRGNYARQLAAAGVTEVEVLKREMVDG